MAWAYFTMHLLILLRSVWKTVDAPRYLIGYSWTIALDVGMLGMLFILRSYWNREKKRIVSGGSKLQAA